MVNCRGRVPDLVGLVVTQTANKCLVPDCSEDRESWPGSVFKVERTFVRSGGAQEREGSRVRADAAEGGGTGTVVT